MGWFSLLSQAPSFTRMAEGTGMDWQGSFVAEGGFLGALDCFSLGTEDSGNQKQTDSLGEKLRKEKQAPHPTPSASPSLLGVIPKLLFQANSMPPAKLEIQLSDSSS